MDGLSKQIVIAFLACSDVAATRAFYSDVLKLEFRTEDSFALVYALPGIELRIQIVQNFKPHLHTAFGWSVNSIDETTQILMENGVEFIRYDGLEQNERGIWHSPSGARIAWFKDPEDNILSLTEYN